MRDTAASQNPNCTQALPETGKELSEVVQDLQLCIYVPLWACLLFVLSSTAPSEMGIILPWETEREPARIY